MPVLRKVSVIIVTYNVKNLIINCLKSIRGEPVVREVVIVDNASWDGTIEAINEHFPEWKNLILIKNKTNVGFAKACNQGIALASGDYILLLNPDTIVNPDVITILAKYLDENPDAGVIGPRILYEDGTLQLSCGKRPSIVGSIFDSLSLYKLSPYFFARNRYGNWKHDQPRDVDWVSGACLMIRRQLVFDLGGLDENFFFTAEDVDLCYRVQQKGYRIVYYPLVTIIHLGAQSSRKVRPMILLKSYQSKLYFFYKHYGKAAVLILRTAFSISSTIKATFAIVAALFGLPKYRDIFRAHFRAILQVWKVSIPKPSKER